MLKLPQIFVSAVLLVFHLYSISVHILTTGNVVKTADTSKMILFWDCRFMEHKLEEKEGNLLVGGSLKL